jgi:hypothetical protein
MADEVNTTKYLKWTVDILAVVAALITILSIINIELFIICILSLTCIYLLIEHINLKKTLNICKFNEEIQKAYFGCIHALEFEEKNHHLISIEKNVKVIGTDANISYIFEGVNISNHLSDGLIIKIGSDNTADLKQLNCKVYDLKSENKKPLSPIVTGDDKDGRAKMLKLPFTRAIPNGGGFKVQLDFTWPNAMPLDQDYIYYPISPFKNGVDKVASRIEFQTEPSLIRMYYLDPQTGNIALDQEQPTKIDSKTFLWSKTGPKNDYLLVFIRELNAENQNA